MYSNLSSHSWRSSNKLHDLRNRLTFISFIDTDRVQPVHGSGPRVLRDCIFTLKKSRNHGSRLTSAVRLRPQQHGLNQRQIALSKIKGHGCPADLAQNNIGAQVRALLIGRSILKQFNVLRQSGSKRAAHIFFEGAANTIRSHLHQIGNPNQGADQPDGV